MSGMLQKRVSWQINMDLSVIILSYNTKNLTRDCLTRVVQAGEYAGTNGIDLEIIVVDNASTDGSPRMIQKEFPKVRLLSQKKNTGFTGGNNLGMKVAKGDYFLLLNSDAFLGEDTLDLTIGAMKRHSDWGVLGCKLVYPDGLFQPSGGYLPTPLNIVSWMMGLDLVPGLRSVLAPVHPGWPGFFYQDRQMGWVTGAFMCLRREVWEKTGGFDEKFFLYMEEVEWCKRIADAGFRIGFTPAFSVIHMGRASSNFDNAGALVKEAQGLLHFIKKHYKGRENFIREVIVWGNWLRRVAFTVIGDQSRADASKKIISQI